MIFRPKVKGFTGKPQVLTSPTGQESFDAIEVSDNIGVEYQKTAAGYTATLTIPQAALCLALKPGLELKFDLGLIYDCHLTPQGPSSFHVDVKMTLTAPGCGMGRATR